MIFVVGNSRSGTTMLGRILGQHSDIYTFEELHFFENLVNEAEVLNRPLLDDASARALIARILTSARYNIFAESDHGALSEEVDLLLRSCERQDAIEIYRCVLNYEVSKHGKVEACEQTPRYLFALDEIFSVFPDAKIVNLIRDPRDVLLSQKNKWRTYFHGSWDMPLIEAVRVWANYHPLLIAKLWVACVARIDKYSGDSRVLSLRFEDLVAHPDASVMRICDHVGVAYQARMLEIADIGSSVKKDKPGAIGINKGASARWRQGGLSASELGICSLECAERMANCGYVVEVPRFAKLFYWLSVPSLLGKGVLSVLLNLSRNKDIIGAIRKRFFR